ncbi:MAG: NADP-dependent oxidoreductase [Rhizobacter sp.]|nr:NADP-dependent oxidoreductase [Chlorobiales bacterium]
MTAVRIHAYGDASVLKYETGVPRPVIAEHDVLVKVHAVAVNPVDWKIREGYMKDYLKHKLPLILGWDVSGVVEEVGSAVTTLKVGDEVYGLAPMAKDGGYAEYISVVATALVQKPKSLSHVEAASLPVATLTAWNSLFDIAKLQAGQTVLIHGAAGGVGSMAVQLAKWKQAKVIGTASAKNAEFLHSLGVDEGIDYTAVPFEDKVKDADVVFDTVGGETLSRSYAVVKKGGVLITAVGQPSDEEAAKYGITAVRCGAVTSEQRLTEIAVLADAGKIKPLVQTVMPLIEAADAHRLSQSGRTRGKIVLQIV